MNAINPVKINSSLGFKGNPPTQSLNDPDEQWQQKAINSQNKAILTHAAVNNVAFATGFSAIAAAINVRKNFNKENFLNVFKGNMKWNIPIAAVCVGFEMLMYKMNNKNK